MDISNRTLGLLLIAAIVVSIGSTFFMLDNMNTIPTGFATLNDDGTVNLTVGEYASITLVDDVIDFGECDLDITGGAVTTVFDSAAQNTDCDGAVGTAADFMNLSNDGTALVSVTIASDVTGASLWGTAGAMSVTLNEDSTSGCGTSPATDVVVSTSPASVCSSFDIGGFTHISAEVTVDNDDISMPTGGLTTWTFVASTL